MRALFAILVTGIVALTAGFAGFQLGVASNLGTTGTVLVMGGFHPFGFLFFLFFAGLLLFAIAGRRRAWAHGRGFGPGHGRGWSGGPMGDPNDPNDPRRAWIVEAHRRLHEEEARTGSSPADAPRQDPPKAG